MNDTGQWQWDSVNHVWVIKGSADVPLSLSNITVNGYSYLNGKVGIGCNPGAMLDVQQDNNGTTGAIRIRSNSVSGYGYLQFTDSTGNGQYGYARVGSDGQFYWSGTIASTSDQRLKFNIRKIDEPYRRLSNISGYTYNRNDLHDPETKYAGVIAQEVEIALPEAVVKGTETEPMAVDYNAIIALLVEVAKEQQQTINRMDGRITSLELLNTTRNNDVS